MPPYMLSLIVALHALSAVVWIGGMFFAYLCLRPAAGSMQPPHRLKLWAAVLERFFPWVWLAVIILLASGLWMMLTVFGGLAQAAAYIHVMFGLGIVMMLLFMHVYFAPFRRLKRAVAATDWTTGAAQLSQIRRLVGINLVLGLIVVVVATGGRYWAAG